MSRFWIDVTGLCHTSIWLVLNIFTGLSSELACLCSAETQRDQFVAVGEPRDPPDFNTKNAAEAHAWLEEFVASGRGVNRDNLKHFSTRDVGMSYRRLDECSAGIDGLTKMRAKPAATMVLHEIAALPSYRYAFGTPITDWSMCIVTSIRKKCLDLGNMDSYRGILFLSLVRKWSALTLLPEIE